MKDKSLKNKAKFWVKNTTFPLLKSVPKMVLMCKKHFKSWDNNLYNSCCQYLNWAKIVPNYLLNINLRKRNKRKTVNVEMNQKQWIF